MKPRMYIITISHLNERGYGVAYLEDGRQIQVLNTLPGETVIAQSFKHKKGKVFAQAIQISTPSPHRIKPQEQHFLSSSPWQIMDFAYENQIKSEMIAGFFAHNGVPLQPPTVVHDGRQFGYRNKVEFGFFSHDETEFLEFSYFKREGSKGKYPLTRCELMPEAVNQVALSILQVLRATGVTARQLKSLLLRYSFSENTVVASLFVKDPLWQFPADAIETIMQGVCIGFQVSFSDPRSPASIVTDAQIAVGTDALTETICGVQLTYSAHGFFQVNPPMFEKCMQDVRQLVWNHPGTQNRPLVDMYAGVGTIGLCLHRPDMQIDAVEISPGSKAAAMANAQHNGITSGYTFTESSAEKSLQAITAEATIVLDPPRIGLHADVISRLRQVQPEVIVYVSCNPQTQARDIQALYDMYDIFFSQAYNFYPRTPHCEHVVLLQKRG